MLWFKKTKDRKSNATVKEERCFWKEGTLKDWSQIRSVWVVGSGLRLFDILVHT